MNLLRFVVTKFSQLSVWIQFTMVVMVAVIIIIILVNPASLPPLLAIAAVVERIVNHLAGREIKARTRRK